MSFNLFQPRPGDTSTLQNQRGMPPKMRPDSWDGHLISFEGVSQCVMNCAICAICANLMRPAAGFSGKSAVASWSLFLV